MKRPIKFYIPTTEAEDWKHLLAEPERHWQTGHSAKALAYCWEDARGLPNSVEKVFSESGYPVLKKILPLLALPEYQVPLPGGSSPSQNDIFILARSDVDLVTIAVEGKVKEPFGPLVSEWSKNASTGKVVRLEFIQELLELGDQPLDKIRYQLLHRTASALIEARWFNASTAIMLVHSFSQDHAWLEDYNEFLGLFDKTATPDSVTFVGQKNGIDLYLSWVTGEERYLEI
jgi:hypothetical protein